MKLQCNEEIIGAGELISIEHIYVGCPEQLGDISSDDSEVLSSDVSIIKKLIIESMQTLITTFMATKQRIVKDPKERTNSWKDFTEVCNLCWPKLSIE